MGKFKIHITKEELEELYVRQQLTTYQIAEMLGVDRTTICWYLKKFTVQTRNKQHIYEENCKINLTQLQYDFVLGTTLGDGHIKLGTARLCGLSLIHSAKQRQYLEWKKQILGDLASEIKELQTYNKQVNKTYSTVRLVTKGIPDFNNLRQLFYKDNIKVIRPQLKNILKSPISLATWYMDDGSLNKSDKRSCICTDSFTYEEHLILQEILKDNFDLEAKIYKYNNKYFRLRFGQKETRKLSKMLEPIVIESMKYKLVL